MFGEVEKIHFELTSLVTMLVPKICIYMTEG